jgi:hypothetical protein
VTYLKITTARYFGGLYRSDFRKKKTDAGTPDKLSAIPQSANELEMAVMPPLRSA